jgi:hypothetical protein
MRRFRPTRIATIAAVVGSSLALTAGTLMLTAGPAGAAVSNAGTVQVAFSGSLMIGAAALPITITGITATATGTVDTAGNIVLPQGSILFAPVTASLPIIGNTPVTIQPTADWTGTIDPNSGILNLSAPQTAHLDLTGASLPDPDCPIGPLALNLTTGASGTATGTPYSTSTGSAGIVDGTFGIPTIPDDNMGLCPDFGLVNMGGPLPIPGGASLADLTAQFTPILVADSDLGLSGVPANITTDATSPKGATVTYTPPTATDEDSPATATVGCQPESGSTFAIGPTTVTCTATDADDSPSMVSQTFTVTVKGVVAQLQDLLGVVQPLPPGTSFFDQVNEVLASLNDPGNTADACGGLGGFINHANAQAGNMITVDQAHSMVAAATRIQAVIGC